jgi:putative nucleotidyltransferase with HDIG domain
MTANTHDPSQAEEAVRLDGLATDLVGELVAAMVNARIYWAEHPRVTESLASVRGTVQELCRATTGDEVRIGLAEQMLVHATRPLLGATVTGTRLITRLADLGAGGIRLSSDVGIEELRGLLALLLGFPADDDKARRHARRDHDGERAWVDGATSASPRREGAPIGAGGGGENAGFAGINADLLRRGIHGVALLAPYSEGVGADRPSELPIGMYQQVMDLLHDTTVDVCQGGRVRFDRVQEVAESMLHRLVAGQEHVLSLARHEQYDAFTFGHSVRVAVLALHFATHLTDSRELAVRIGTAALLHDVGKSLVPFEILHSRRPLTDEERRIMRSHTEHGARILSDQDGTDDLAIAAAFGHHTSDGPQGYPATLHEHQASTITELIKVCDVYEALTAARPYKRPMTPTRAYRIMLAERTHFRPDLLRRFVEVNGLHPAGQLLELDSGEIAQVVAQTPGDLHHPRVRLLTDAECNPLRAEERPVVDLSRLGADGSPRGIRNTFDRSELDAVLRALEREQARRERAAAECGRAHDDAPLRRAELAAARAMMHHGDACSHRELLQPPDEREPADEVD